MNDLSVFKNDTLNVSIRIVEKNGEPWFVAKDVADALGYNQTSDMTRRLDDDEKDKFIESAVITDSVNSGDYGYLKTEPLTIINESGLYSAILGSKKQEAKAFKKWVTSEVLPSIRKTGSYLSKDKIPQTYGEALLEYAKTVCELEKKEVALREAIKTKAYISDKKTATAMNTASQLSKENMKLIGLVDDLETKVDESKHYATIKKVELLTGKKFKYKPLKDQSNLLNIEIRRTFDVNYGEVNSYHKDIWMKVYNIDITVL